MKEKILATILGLMLLSPVVSAQEETRQSGGILPGSFLYRLDKAFEKVELFLTRGLEERAKLHLSIANERLAELRNLQDQNITEHYDELVSAYNKQLNMTEDELASFNMSEAMQERVRLMIAEHTARHQTVLSRVMEKAPQRAIKGLERAFEHAQTKHENALNKSREFSGKQLGKLKRTLGQNLNS